MKISAFLLFICIIQVFADDSYSQTARLTLSMSNATVEQVLGEIEAQSEFYILYNHQLVDVSRRVNIEVSNKKIKNILNALFENTNVDHLVLGRQIILSSKDILNEGVAKIKGTQEGIEVKGTVTDEDGNTLPGVNIIVKGTLTGAITDADGNYNIEVEDSDATLVFSFIGMKTLEVEITGQTSINVTLQQDVTGLDEIIVVGYTARKKSTITGAVSIVDMSDLDKTRIPNVSQAMQGKIAGVLVTSSTGAPGDPIQIRIRGEGTIGNNNPLYVIDGIPSRDITFLNQADIKSMTVLKDAAAAAIYGSRASGGVVLITTKSGTKGKTSFGVNYFTGIHSAKNLPTMLNAEQYMNTVEKAWNNSDRTGTNPYTTDKGRSDFSDTDWLDELFEQGISHNLQVSASGGSDKLQFLMSLGYYGQDGIVVFDNDKYQRFNYRTNINAKLSDRLKIGTNLQLTHSTQDKTASKGESLIRFALLRVPVLSVYKDVNDPTYSERDPFTDMPFFTPTGYDVALQRTMYEMVGNPIAQAFFMDDKRTAFQTFGNVYGEYAFLQDKELTFRTNLGIDLSLFHNKAFNENYGDDDGGGSAIDQGLGRRNRPNNLNESRGEAFTYTFNNTLNYIKNFNDLHDFNAMIGTEYIVNYASSIGASRKRYTTSDEIFRYIDYGGPDLDIWNNGTASEWALFSYFGSASYVLDKKYMVTANFRADASSRFSENNRWGYFPSISAGWKISDESFLNNVDWLSNLKLRASWGKLGNQEIDDYAYLTLISQTEGKVIINRYGNPDLKWETSTQSNIGIDFGLFDAKLAMSVEYFGINTTDILLPIGLPGVVGNVEPTILNAGEVSNKGFEFTLNYRNSVNEFKYGINVNLATLTNNVEKLHPNLPSIVGNVTRTEVGQPLNAYYGYTMVGIYQNQGEIDSYLHGTVNPTEQPGDIKFNDLNNDGVINSNDRDFIGSPIPDLTYGLSLTAGYKGFDFFMLFQGVQGVDRYNDGKKILDFDTRPFNYTTNVLGAWDGDGSSNTIPRVTFQDNGSSKVSSIYVEDASYFRLKNVEFGYTIKLLKGVQDIRFYISGQNLFTITDYTGLDPETVDFMDLGTYPSSRTFLFGVNVNF